MFSFRKIKENGRLGTRHIIPAHSIEYRPEIDGLRSFAVIPVILYHAKVPGFAGGFLGVDFFFVISGFLITSILVKELEQGRFSLLEFYERRARRILPALFTVIVFTIPFAYLLLLPRSFSDFSQSAVASIFSVSNFYFWKTSNYFAVDADLKPLLHTWSLAVEEQYYLIYPAALMLAWSWGRKIIMTLILLVFLSSLALSEFASARYQTANFFLLPTRGWELLAGAACALLRTRWSYAGNDWLAASGLGLMVWSVFAYDDAMLLPSLLTLPAIAGPALILVFARQRKYVARLLAWPPFVFVGLVSYSAYLWHQPIFALSRTFLSRTDQLVPILICTVLTFVLATLTYVFVELPFRYRGSRARISNRGLVVVLSSGAFTLSAVCVLGLWEISRGSFHLKPIVVSRALVDVAEEQARSWSAFAKNPDLSVVLRRFDPGAANKVLIVGDSHAKDMFNMLYPNRASFDNTDFRVAFFSDGCMAPPQLVEIDRETLDCLERFSIKHAALVEEASHVVFSMRWSKMPTDRLEPVIRTASRFFKDKGKVVAISSNAVEFEPEPPFLMAKLFRQGRVNPQDAGHLFFQSRRLHVEAVNDVVHRTTSASANFFLRKADFMCRSESAMCVALTPEGDAAFFDSHHYTVAGARFFGAEAFKEGWLRAFLEAQPEPAGDDS